MVVTKVNFLNNPQGVYYSGQQLVGEIEIENEKTRSIQCVKLKIEGFAECKWSESEGSGKSRRTVTYRGHEDYLKTISYIFGTDKGDKIDFPSGIHKFNFSCQLPPNLPTSYESSTGQIRYHVKVVIERPWKLDIKTTFGFTVIRVSDLNYIQPTLRTPAKGEISKTFFLGFGSSALVMSAEIPISGFVSGQAIPVSVRIVNQSSVDVETVKISIKQIVQYISKTPRRKIREKIQTSAAQPFPGIKSKDKGGVDGQVVVPPAIPTNLGTCSVIQIYYELHVSAKVGGLHRSPVIKIPITIGTVPLYQMPFPQPIYPQLPSDQPFPYHMQQAQPSSSYQQPMSLNINPSAPPTVSNEDLPPPSYEIAMGMTSETTDEFEERLNDETSFNPRYPVYNFSNTTQTLPTPPPSYGFSFDQKEKGEKQ